MSALLNQRRITGPDAVFCLLGGVDDQLMKTTAKARNHQTPKSLLQYLNTIADVSGSSGEFVKNNRFPNKKH